MRQYQIPSLTGLRLFAAAAVVISHAIPKIVVYDHQPEMIYLLSQISAAGMTLFFVLSGFVIFLNYSRAVHSGGQLWNFLVARFARLYPLYFVCLAFDLLMKFSYNQLPNLSSLPYYLTLSQSWFYQLIGGHSLIFQFGLMPQVSWSISAEAMLYLSFPLICMTVSLLHSVRATIVAGVLVGIVALVLLAAIGLHTSYIQAIVAIKFGTEAVSGQDSFLFWLTYFSPYLRVFEFLLGCLCASIYMTLEPPSPIEEWMGVFLTAVPIVLIFALHLVFFGIRVEGTAGIIVQQWRLNFGYAPAAGLLIFCCARYRNPIVGFLSGKWIVLGGEVSYSIYMLHVVMINAFRYEAPKITAWNVALGSWLQLTLVLASIAGLSLVSWRFIERPSRAFLRSYLSVRSAPEPGVGAMNR